MNRELKLALIIGFSLVLLVTVLISDHLSKARGMKLAEPETTPGVIQANTPSEPIASIPGVPAPRQTAVTPTNTGGGLALGDPSPDTAATSIPTDIGVQRIDQINASGGSLAPVDLSGPRTSPSDQSLIDAAKKQNVRLEPLTPEPEPLTVMPGKPAVAEPRTTVAPAMREYVVVDGDSMVKIAKKTLGDGGKWKLIADANPKTVGKKGEVRAGTKLQIPVIDSPIAQNTKAPVRFVDSHQSPIDFGPPSKSASKPDPKAQTGRLADAGPLPTRKTSTKTYVVKPGDTLNTIAKRLLGSASRTEDLLRANPDLENEDHIQVGDEIKLPMS